MSALLDQRLNQKSAAVRCVFCGGDMGRVLGWSAADKPAGICTRDDCKSRFAVERQQYNVRWRKRPSVAKLGNK